MVIQRFVQYLKMGVLVFLGGDSDDWNDWNNYNDWNDYNDGNDLGGGELVKKV